MVCNEMLSRMSILDDMSQKTKVSLNFLSIFNYKKSRPITALWIKRFRNRNYSLDLIARFRGPSYLFHYSAFSLYRYFGGNQINWFSNKLKSYEFLSKIHEIFEYMNFTKIFAKSFSILMFLLTLETKTAVKSCNLF